MSEPTVGEQWRSVPGYEGLYEVSDLGRVWTAVRRGSTCSTGGLVRGGMIRKPVVADNGHLALQLVRDGVRRHFYVHRLVLLAFVGEPPEGHEGCHENDDPLDNRLANLRWDTRSANRHDCIRNGRDAAALKTHCRRGHPLAGSNITRRRDGRRSCAACNAALRHICWAKAKGRAVPDAQVLSDQLFADPKFLTRQAAEEK